MNLLLILIACFVGYFLIKFWIKIVNAIFIPIEKAIARKQNLPEPKNEEKEEVKDNPKTNIGEFDLSDFPEKDRNKSFYFFEYNKPDGEWIDIDEPICKIRIGEYSGFYRFKSASVISTEAGILEHTQKKDDLLINGNAFYRFHKKGEYQNENSTGNSEFKEHFKSSNFRSFDKWLVSDGDYVEIDTPIFQFNDYNFQKHKNYSKKAGFVCLIDPKKVVSLKANELMYIIRESDKQRVKERFINISNQIIDEFSKSTTIKWDRVSSSFFRSEGIKLKSDDRLTDFLFTFNYINDSDHIVFHFNPKQTRPKQFDKVLFLFESEEQIQFELTVNPISLKNKKGDKIVEYKVLITKSELEQFSTLNLKKWKISLVGDKREILGGDIGGDGFYYSKNNLQIVTKKFANEYMNLVKKTIPDYKPTELKQGTNTDTTITEFCFVYLMFDTSNGYYKIGISNKPEYRERTLQSEKPTIEMIASKRYPTRPIAESIEKALHGAYSEKRLRGEWFELDVNDVENIRETLK